MNEVEALVYAVVRITLVFEIAVLGCVAVAVAWVFWTEEYGPVRWVFASLAAIFSLMLFIVAFGLIGLWIARGSF